MATIKVYYQTSDSSEFLVAKGDFSKAEIIKAAIEQNVIEGGEFDGADFYQSHYKTVPSHPNSGFKSWNSPRETPCKGSYFASVLRK